MQQGFYEEHWTDHEDRPAGGVSTGRGFTISWQNGPLGRGEDRKEPNGAFVEDVIVAAIQRIEFYQTASEGRFSCVENALALGYLHAALKGLEERTREREARQVEGTHAV